MSTRSAFTLLFFLFVATASRAQYMKGMDFDDAAYKNVPKKASLTRGLDIVPARASIKQYAPTPQNQGMFGTCTAWATAYCGRTIVEAIKNNWTDKATITAHAYSPAFLFRMLLPGDQGCVGGSSVSAAFDLMKEKGDVLYKDIPLTCIPSVSDTQLATAKTGKIKDYAKLFDADATEAAKVKAVKKSLSEKKPVVIGMICPPSFMTAKGAWAPNEQALDSYGGHALCVVGYDDDQYGGAFEIQNSWGPLWGNQGYIWIKYADFAKFNRYAYEFIDLPESKPNLEDLSGEIRLVLSTGTAMPANLFISTRGLKVVPATTTPGPFTTYQNAVNYTSGTRFRIYISNNQPAYVYALSTDNTNEITKIFPYETGISAALTYKRNDVAIPDEDHYIEFDNRPGKDVLCVLYSKDELNIDDIIKRTSAETGTFSERLFKVIGDKVVDPQNIQFSKDKIAFQGISNGKKIAAMLVELNHVQ